MDPGSKTALAFAQSLLSQNHKYHLKMVFFYLAAVNHANALVQIPTDEIHLTAQWQSLSQQHEFPLHICSTSAAQHGIISEVNLADHFVISGLGQLSYAIMTSDRVIEF